MKRLFVTFLYLIVLLGVIEILTDAVQGAPYAGETITVQEADGSLVEVRVWGDEYYIRAESLDGYTLTRDPETGFICYADLDEGGEAFVSTGIRYTGAAEDNETTICLASEGIVLPKGLRLPAEVRRKKAEANRKLLEGVVEGEISVTGITTSAIGADARLPLIGDVRGVTLLIDFPEEPWTIPWENVDQYCNQEGYTGYGNNGSIRDYWHDVSNGLLDYTNYVTPFYYTALYSKAYYSDPTIPNGQRAKELVLEALNYLESQGFDFSSLTINEKSRILAINAFYVGDCQNAWAEGLWPHKGGINDLFQADGVKSGSYQISYMRNSLYLGTFCHENGHLICNWPDLYDGGYESFGIGEYGLMGYGLFAEQGYNPMPPNPYYRALKGWETIVDITDDPAGTMYTHQANSFVTYRYSHPFLSSEFFLIESRVRSGRNSGVGDEGVIIWHIEENGSNNNEQMTADLHYLVSVEQADGLFDLERYQNPGGPGDLFHAGWRDVFDNTTVPDAKWWDETRSGLRITQISDVGTVMTFVKENEEGIIHVRSGMLPGGDGRNWNTAFNTLEEAIDAAGTSGEIWVSEGTYLPSGEVGGTGERYKAFSLKNGVRIYGGFPVEGNPGWADRKPDMHLTILSGDLGAAGDSSDNCYHVIHHAAGSDLNATAALDGCVIRGGNANGTGSENRGGGMYNSGSSPTIVNCRFAGNAASEYGGGMYNGSGSCPAVTNCVFSGNTANSGGGMCSTDLSNPSVINASFSENSAGVGIAMSFLTGSVGIVANSILWSESDASMIHCDGSSGATVSYSDVRGGWEGTGNVDSDPLFLDPLGADGIAGTTDDILRIQGGSPCIDSGDNLSIPGGVENDLAGNPRKIDDLSTEDTGNGSSPLVDMGAYEYRVIYVRAGAESGGDGLSWSSAFRTLEEGMNLSVTGDFIFAGTGTYFPNVEVGGSGERYRSFQLKDGVKLYGGFAGTGNPGWSERDPASYPTILSGDIGVTGDTSDNCYHVVHLPMGLNIDSTAVLDGFVIVGGNANGAWTESRGGGMYNDGSSPMLVNCRFEDNAASETGGGVSFSNSDSNVIRCTFFGNIASYGGGVYTDSDNVSIRESTFLGNIATVFGGGICIENSGGLTVMDSIFSGNNGTYYGGGIFTCQNEVILLNCTFSGNTADCGGGLEIMASEVRAENCLFWGNTASMGSQIDNGGATTVRYSNIQGGYSGEGNLNADPLFADADGADGIIGTQDDDLHLSENSPCLDGGDPSGDYGGRKDIDGQRRDCYGRTDIGADEINLIGGDVDSDGDVDDMDMELFLEQWLEECGGSDWCGGRDIDKDGRVGLLDWSRMARHWLRGV